MPGGQLAQMPGEGTLPNRIRELRLRQKLTQAELALLIGKDASTVAKQEIGARPVSREELRAYARVFKCEPIDIITFEENDPDPSVDLDDTAVARIEQEDALLSGSQT